MQASDDKDEKAGRTGSFEREIWLMVVGSLGLTKGEKSI